jgi:hypothetical protein
VPGGFLGPSPHHLDPIRELQRGDALGQEGHSTEQRLDQDDGHIRSSEGPHQTGEPCAGTNIGDSGPSADDLKIWFSDDGAVDDVSIPHLVGFSGTQEPPLDARSHQDVRILRE